MHRDFQGFKLRRINSDKLLLMHKILVKSQAVLVGPASTGLSPKSFFANIVNAAHRNQLKIEK